MIEDMSVIKRRHEGHWFDPSSMRFFRSRVGSFGYTAGGKTYFVSSEQFEDSRGNRAGRLYTVRVQDHETGDIDTVGEFQQYASRSGADAAAQRMAKEVA